MSTSIGLRIRQLREEKGLSQGDIEETSGLLRCYVSRVENGHTVPSLETLERFAAALSVPVYRFFYTGEDTPSTPNLTPRATLEQLVEEGEKDSATTRFLLQLKRCAEGIADKDRKFLLTIASKLATR